MRVISRRLYKNAQRVLDMVHERDGSDKGIMIAGTWVDVDERLTAEGEQEGIAVLYSVRDIVDVDFIEDALKEFIHGTAGLSKVMIAEKPENQWKKQNAEITRALRKFFEKQGTDKETAMIEAMYAAGGFGAVKKGFGWGGAHFEDLADIAENALREYDSVDLTIAKEGDPFYWDGHIRIDVLKTRKKERET